MEKELHQPTIIQAIAASCIATEPGEKPVLIDGQQYVSGINGCINPIEELCWEMQRLSYSPEEIACITSVGKGAENLPKWGSPATYQQMTRDPRGAERRASRQMTGGTSYGGDSAFVGRYFRFSLEQGMHDILKNIWDMSTAGAVLSHTQS